MPSIDPTMCGEHETTASAAGVRGVGVPNRAAGWLARVLGGSRARRCRWCGTAVLLLAAVAVSGASPVFAGPASCTEDPRRESSTDKTSEYEVKAAFLYKFITFTTWPKDAFPDKKAPVIVEVVGQDPFRGLLGKTFKGKDLHGRPFIVRHSRRVPERIDSHVVFVGKLTAKERKLLFQRTAKKPVLVVGDQAGLASVGAIVNMYLVKGKVRFEINPDTAKVSRIKISSQLLKLARIVRNKKEDEGR